MNKTIIQGLTLFFFFSLIFGFVAYRSGYLGGVVRSPIPFDPNGTVLNNSTEIDSATLAELRAYRMMLFSSKAMVIRDPRLDSLLESGIVPDSQLILPALRKPFIPSSKSAPILRKISPKELRKMKRRDKKRYRQQEKERKKAAKNQNND